MLPHGRRVLAEPKEVALLGGPLQRNAVRIFIILELGIRSLDELFGALVVPAVVPLQEHVALLRAPPPQLPAARLVPFTGRSQVVVVSDVEPFVQGLEARHARIYQLLGCYILCSSRVRDLLAVLVCPGQHEGLLAAQPVVPRHDISNQRLVGVAHVGRTIGIVDRRRHVVLSLSLGKVRRAEQFGQGQGRLHGYFHFFLLLALALFLCGGRLRRNRGLRRLRRFGCFCLRVAGGADEGERAAALIYRCVGGTGAHDDRLVALTAYGAANCSVVRAACCDR
mmetsp:Transcript_23954/g.62465  ORF Transcript_23954/g.62465 Transcript_23954/m.62465 type:complete len:281 (-) Transcript_23954:88-930(-)